MKKVGYYIFTALFALFAYFNLNDPDPVLWVLAYGITALLFALAAFGYMRRRYVSPVVFILTFWMCTMVPGMVDWFRLGMPSITSDMQATAPHIEVVREFLGLFIAVGALIFLLVSTPPDQASKNTP